LGKDSQEDMNNKKKTLKPKNKKTPEHNVQGAWVNYSQKDNFQLDN